MLATPPPGVVRFNLDVDGARRETSSSGLRSTFGVSMLPTGVEQRRIPPFCSELLLDVLSHFLFFPELRCRSCPGRRARLSSMKS